MSDVDFIIPDFQTLDELVAFWDDHDFADYWDDLEEVAPAEAMPDRSHRVSVELPFDVLLGAIERLSSEDARRVYERLEKRFGN